MKRDSGQGYANEWQSGNSGAAENPGRQGFFRFVEQL